MRKPENVWKELWLKTKLSQIPQWDYGCELVYYILNRANITYSGKKCLETGSGTGRVSLKLGEEGATSILLDTSKEALRFSKIRAQLRKVDADFVAGSILCLPFRSSSLDVVWSEGVLEHFTFKDQRLIISESLRTLKTKGRSSP